MLSQELVDEWLIGYGSRTELRTRAKMAIIDGIIGDVLDKNNPDEFILSEEIVLKRHTGINILSTHFVNGANSEDCTILYMKGNTICVQDIESKEIWELQILTHLNFFGAIRILEYIEQGKYIK